MSRISASEDRNLGICDKRFGKEKRISSSPSEISLFYDRDLFFYCAIESAYCRD